MSVSHRNRNPPRSESPLGVSVVIATLDRPENLTETIASVAACVPLPAEVVIVDGHEGFSARSVAAAWNRPCAGLSVRYLASPPGLTRQRNAGLAVAGAEIVLFLDDDVTIPPHAVATMLAAYEDPGVAGVTGRVVGDRSQLINRESRLRRFLPGGGREGSFTRFGYPRYIEKVTEPQDVEYMLGCFMSARRDLAIEVGFDERLTGYALAEDEDFSYRLSQRGRIRYLPEIVVEHRLAPHTGSASRALNRMLVVNRAYLFRKNFPPTLAARAQFAFLVVLLVVHRIATRDLAGARGIVEGAAVALRDGGGLPEPPEGRG